MEGEKLVPLWLEHMLSIDFFGVCRSHCAAAKNECNMYCLDCNACEAFCYYCRSSQHKDHHVIQIRKSSYHDVVRVSEIHKFLDISELQTYVINGARVMFLNERPQSSKMSGKGISHLCETCGRGLLDPFRFCSIGCKLKGIKSNKDASFVLEATDEILEIQATTPTSDEKNGLLSLTSPSPSPSKSITSSDEKEVSRLVPKPRSVTPSFSYTVILRFLSNFDSIKIANVFELSGFINDIPKIFNSDLTIDC